MINGYISLEKKMLEENIKNNKRNLKYLLYVIFLNLIIAIVNIYGGICLHKTINSIALGVSFTCIIFLINDLITLRLEMKHNRWELNILKEINYKSIVKD